MYLFLEFYLTMIFNSHINEARVYGVGNLNVLEHSIDFKYFKVLVSDLQIF